jgi:hypothetical protein
MQEMEKAAWYRDEFGKNMMEKVKKMKTYADAEALYALDGERLVKTLHARNDPKPSAPKKRKGEDLAAASLLESDLSASSPENGSSEDDISMDSASIAKLDTPTGQVEAEQGTTGRVIFTRRTTASSADGSAPSLSVGGG